MLVVAAEHFPMNKRLLRMTQRNADSSVHDYASAESVKNDWKNRKEKLMRDLQLKSVHDCAFLNTATVP